MAKQFDGGGYDPGEFTPDERRQHRHMFNELDRNWVVIDEDAHKAMQDAATVRAAARLISNLPKTLGWLGVLVTGCVSAGVWLASKGIL